jgi:Protein of unknown function (DUF2877)
MAVLPAHLVATPVLERLGGELHGVVLGAGATAAWVDLDGFVVAITTREVPLLPNAVALAAGSGALSRPAVAAGTAAGVRPAVAAGTAARFAPGRIDLGAVRITWDPAAPPTWDPTVPVPDRPHPGAVARRGAALLHALGVRSGAATAATAVDSRQHPTSGSATLPLRGPHLPGPPDQAAPAREPRLPGAENQATPARDPRLPEPANQAAPAHEPRLPGAANQATPAHEPRAPGAPDPVVLVRELARVGLATAADPDAAAGLTLLFRAVRERDPEPAAAAACELLGRGPGLTPEGDDLLAGVAGTLAVLGPATGLEGPARDALLAALAPVPGRTTALSATLLSLASERRLAEPAGRLLDLSPAGDAAWPAALARLERLGHGSGRAYAAGIAVTAALLAAGTPVR